jgi:hypothetical protein
LGVGRWTERSLPSQRARSVLKREMVTTLTVAKGYIFIMLCILRVSIDQFIFDIDSGHDRILSGVTEPIIKRLVEGLFLESTVLY